METIAKTQRIGLLVPSSNSTQEPEFAAMLPPCVSLHVTRLSLATVDPDSTLNVVADLERESRKLADADVDVILLAATAPSTRMGKGYDAQLIKRIEDATGRRATTAATAMLEAFAAQGVRRVALAAPWAAQTNAVVAAFLQAHGIEVVSQEAMEVTRNNEIGRLAPATAYELGLKADRSAADAVFLACGNWWTASIVEPLEAALGKPVLTTNNVALWAALRIIGGHASVPGYGRLLRTMPAVPVLAAGRAA
ncbi:MAG: aspartate/glutamate racemase family protein [Burkholderiales bacterium]|nr:aspartate/glutamate racemase family protein [Burkholderiales bacterium]